jgi:hypothetical protein
VPRVLLVLVDAVLRIFLSGELRRAALDVVIADDELEAMVALGAARQSRPPRGFDVIITDAELEGGFGLATAAGRTWRRIPTERLSMFADAELWQEAVRRGIRLPQRTVDIDGIIELVHAIATG